MTDMTQGGAPLAATQDSYMAMVRQKRLYSGIAILVFVVLLVSGFRVANDRNAGGFFDGIHRIFDFPADVVGEAWEKRADLAGLLWKYLPDLIETLNIAAVATLLGAALGLVLSLLSTRGMARWPVLIPLFRRIMDVTRALPEIVVALVLIYMLGGGPIPAMIAIALHTAGALGKLYSEVNENADLKPVDGLTSVGATWSQKMLLGVMPQVAPNYLSYGLLRFEINIRASAILGFVGAGGIGYELRNSMAWGPGRFDEAAAIFILLFVTIVVVDQLSSSLRNRLSEGAKQ
ncbi:MULTISPECIES: phosphonate ABC transporter, permease protein PhnE [Mameliella]|uniref:Putative phosphate uptake ABC transporter permease protein n=1 Tax=Mameliella alba TaxID=561184 RepID=A0A0B3S242_9RHOB|nr:MULTISPECIES: phosphonate ABC transporter, permease protein PhnE [Mameliella]MCR9272984.1 phosphonate ABC transporter, permease protein PhnE [Paracoccaceae bacterium]ODM49476.1 phosphonate ABC transporter, permease protein PhnE [Ruegeria sp. PBVC088]KHQ52963.1 putative phosphate uptake ABC transporter permease protein [Mameliella alba]MDD9730117.1 phosphonate ABC transporter, permease protein PhnE [Mameliella sp. AT18]OWV42709.1 phosphonate ABC transporter, permease protein PhnE [Mameliella